MIETSLLEQTQFPVLYDGEEATAVLVDIDTFRQIELILDNLLNREGEPEDIIIAAATDLWQKVIFEHKQELHSSDWEQELNDI